ncbi:hypothetical protein QEN19_000592 [Hanseniaspora menglaensis]
MKERGKKDANTGELAKVFSVKNSKKVITSQTVVSNGIYKTLKSRGSNKDCNPTHTETMNCNESNKLDEKVEEGYDENKKISHLNYQDVDENNDLVDVLPSFQFYESLVKFLPENNSDEQAPCFNSISTTDILQESDLQSPLNTNPPDYLAVMENSELSRGNSTESLTVVSPCSTSSNPFRYEVDKFHTLPHTYNKKIHVIVVLTKSPVEPDTVSKQENMLKEFSSGELISGYVVVENKSSDRIDFEGFYVSFEGITKVNNNNSNMNTTMRFLKTHDLSATWSYGNVELASGVNYCNNTVDHFDNTILGLPDYKILEPKTKYKKHFCFKIPTEILDNNCKHQLSSHIALPPSFGLDRSIYENVSISVDSLLGYGHAGFKGSPVLTADLASYDEFVSTAIKRHLKSGIFNNKLKQGFPYQGSSIGYNVNCKLVMKNKKTSTPYILNNTVCDIRIVPNTLSSNKKLDHIDHDIGSSNVTNIKKLFANFNTKIIKQIDYLQTLLNKLEHWDSLETFAASDLTEHISDRTEKKNLSQCTSHATLINAKGSSSESLPQNNKASLNAICNSFTYKNKVVFAQKQKSSSRKHLNLINTFMGNATSNSHTESNAASSFDSSLLHKKQSVTTVTIETCLNKNLKALPYHKPKYYSQHNTFETKSKLNKNVWMKQVLPQLPVNVEQYELQSLPITITTDAALSDPPKIKKLFATLKAYTVYSQKALPVVLDSTFMNTEKKLLSQLTDNCIQSLTQIETLNKMYQKHASKLNSLAKKLNVNPNLVRFESFIDNELMSDCVALSSLHVEEFNINNVFVSTKIPSSNLLNWTAVNENEISCTLELNLNYKPDLF